MVRGPALPAPEEAYDKVKGALRDAGLLDGTGSRLGSGLPPTLEWMSVCGWATMASRMLAVVVASDIHRDSCER